jgi:hypothetical protein
MMQSSIPAAERITFFVDGEAVTTVFGRRLPGHQRIADHIEANDYDSAVQVRSRGEKTYANRYGPSGQRIVLQPAGATPKPRRVEREETKWRRLNGPVTVIKPSSTV